MGEVTPKALTGNRYIIVAIDYFTEWEEAMSYAKLEAKDEAIFIKYNIICSYRVRHEIISDNGYRNIRSPITSCHYIGPKPTGY